MDKQQPLTLLEVIRAKDKERLTPKVKPKIQNALLDVVRAPKPANLSIIKAEAGSSISIDKAAPEYIRLKAMVKEAGAEELIKAGRKQYGALITSGKHSPEELAELKEVVNQSEALIKEAAADLKASNIQSNDIQNIINLCSQIR